MRDPYDVLGVGRSASEAEVKRAYRKLAKQYHPDKHAGDKKAQAKFAEINSANEILGDKDKRAKFDRGEIDAEGKPRFQGFEGARAGQGGGFENIDPAHVRGHPFQLRTRRRRRRPHLPLHERSRRPPASSAGGGGARRRRPPALGVRRVRRARARGPAGAPGADLRGEIAVTLEDIAAGRRPKVSLPTGKTVALTLPKGVADGQVIRLQGQGQPSLSGGAPGDALVTVRFVPHPLFKPEGSDLRLDLPVSLDEAVLGAKIAVPTLSGKVQVTVPPHSSSGRVLRLQRQGPAECGRSTATCW